MLKIHLIAVICFLVTALAGCGVAERAAPPALTNSRPNVENQPLMSAVKFGEVEGSLKQAHREWDGTPYVWGGSSPNGIDCSAFIQVVFDQYFSVKLPRNTRSQLYEGRKVDRAALKSGDLVFFKTGRKTLHVGVVIEGDNFLHASTSQGVTISNLDDYYWKSRYMTTKRVLNYE